MNILKKNKEYVVILIINIMFSLYIISKCYLITNTNYILLLSEVIGCILIYFIFNYFFHSVINRIVIISSILAIFLAIITFTGKVVAIYNKLSNKYLFISKQVNTHCTIGFNDIRIFFIILIPIIIFLLLILIRIGYTNSIFIFSITIVILFWSLGFQRAIKANIVKLIILSIVTFGISNCSNELKKKNINIKINYFKLMLFALVTAIVISEISIALPYSNTGRFSKSVEGKLVKDYGDTKIEELEKKSFDLKLSGYKDNNSRLGGPIFVNDELVLKVRSEKPEYLRADVKDYYDGTMWTKTGDRHRNVLRKFQNIYSFENYINSALYNQKTMEILPMQNKLSTLFTPMYTSSINMNGVVFYDDIPTFIGKTTQNRKYELEYYSMNETKAFENCKNMKWMNEDFNQDYYSLYNKYMQLPDTITDRTQSMLKKIISGSRGPYERILKIKQYLQSNYTYSTSVSSVPDNKDFVDYFLFDEKKGYCVYFASAATILCRLAGIPARYVEGFRMEDNKDSEGFYNVTNKEAHAWCEVLVDPEKDLWSILEATPSNSEVSHGNSSIQSEINSNKNSSNNSNNESVKKTQKNVNKVKESVNNKKFIYIFVIIFMVIVLKNILQIINRKKMLKENSNLPLYKFMIKRLKSIGVVKPEHMGDLEYCSIINDEELREIYYLIASSVYEEVYRKNISNELNKEMAYRQLENYIKHKDKKLKYYLKKYLYF